MKTFNTLKPKEIKIATFDLEVYKWINPYAVSMYDGNEYKYFLGKTCISDFLKYILRHRYRAYTFFAHNGGLFDFNFIIEMLKNWNYDLHLIFQGSRCLQLKIYLEKLGELQNRKSRNNIKFSDSYALLRYSLDKLTKDFNAKHQKLNFMPGGKKDNDYDYLYEVLYKNREKIFFDYIQNDVIGLYEVLNKFNSMIQKHNGRLSYTIASTSLKTFQTGYLKNKIIMSNRKTNDEMKNGYYGGRVEIFKMYVDKDKYYCYDVNSLYPYVMFNNIFPVTKPRKIINTDIDLIKNSLGITYCQVMAPKDLYLPLLPYHYNIGNYSKLVFPIGSFKGYWDNVLLVKALELGYKIKPIYTYIFDGEYIFKDYVTRFYELKKKSKKESINYIVAKLLLNSLYGKFAQNQDSESLKKITDPQDLQKYEITDVYDLDHNIFRVKTESKGNFFIPQISIHVTSLAQLHLYNIMEKIINKGYKIIYCDTDSVFTNAKLNKSDQLGELKEEYKFKKGYFILPKTYCIIDENDKTIIKAKGYMSMFKKMITEKDFKNALFNDDYSGFTVISKEEKFNSMKASYVRHKKYVSTDLVKKSIKHRYDKRIRIKDFDTKPLEILE